MSEALSKSDALAILDGALPRTDPENVWYAAFRTIDDRCNQLGIIVFAIVAPVTFALLFAVGSAVSAVFHISVGIRIGVGAIGALGSNILLRDTIASIPGFGWAKEYRQLCDVLAPYRDYLNWREAKDRSE